MEALVAVGLASNILQFTDVAYKFASSFDEIRKSNDGITKEIAECRRHADQVRRDVAEALKLIPEDQDHEFHAYAKDLQAAIDGYMGELDQITVKDAKSRRESMKAVLKTWRKKDYFQDSLITIERMGDQVTRHVIGILLPRTEYKLDTLLGNDKRLEEQLSDQTQRLLLQVRDSASDTRTSTVALIETWFSQQEKAKARQKCLHALYFPQLESRKDQIRDADVETFHWVLEGDEWFSTRSKFRDWLRSDDHTKNVFWISGKPGSGKSTLMKFLVHHPQLKTSLQAWSVDQDMELVLADYYFWRHGSPLQKSSLGLLRSLLWQIFRNHPELIDIAFESDIKWMSGGRDFQFTVSELRNTMQCILRSAPRLNLRFIIFIDGLDEFDERDELNTSGPVRDEQGLIEFLRIFHHSPAVKLCVSSRPNPAFVTEFGNDHKQFFRLHLMTRKDIETYVRRNLVMDNMFRKLCDTEEAYKDLVYEIVEAAEGVFVWVHFTCRLLLRGITYQDSISDLQQKLRRLPRELEDSYDLMLSHHDDPVYELRAARLLLANSLADDLEFELTPLVTESLWSGPSAHQSILNGGVSIEYLQQKIGAIEKRTNAYCSGFMQVFNTHNITSVCFEYSHRTVGDFLQRKRIRDSLIAKSESTPEDIILSVIDGYVAIISLAKQLQGRKNDANDDNVKHSKRIFNTFVTRFFGIISRIYAEALEKRFLSLEPEDVFTRLLRLEAIFHLDTPPDYRRTDEARNDNIDLVFSSKKPRNIHPGGGLVWASCSFKADLRWNILGVMAALPGRKWSKGGEATYLAVQTAPLLQRRLEMNPELLQARSEYVPPLYFALLYQMHNTDLHGMLFEHGANPNEQFGETTTPWRCFLAQILCTYLDPSLTHPSGQAKRAPENMDRDTWARSMLPSVRLCLQHGADPNAVCDLVAYVDHFWHTVRFAPLYRIDLDIPDLQNAPSDHPRGTDRDLKRSVDTRIFCLRADSLIRYLYLMAEMEVEECLLPMHNEPEDVDEIIEALNHDMRAQFHGYWERTGEPGRPMSPDMLPDDETEAEG